MIKYIPIMVIGEYEFKKKLSGDLQTFINEIETARKELKKISEYFYDNNICRFSNIFGDEFSFMLYKDKYAGNDVFSISVWNYLGTTLIFDSRIPVKNRIDFINELFHDCEEFTKGKKKCSDCGKWINYRDLEKNRYFAGIYCDACWNRKWKAIEEKENYE